MKPDQHKWVVIFLIYADFISNENNTLSFSSKLAGELDAMLSDILDNDFDEARLSKYIVFASVNYVPPLNAGKATAKSNTYLLKVGRDSSNCNEFQFIHQVPAEAANLENAGGDAYSIQKKGTLTEVFSYISKHEKDNGYEDFKKMMITWDHGSAFGIFKTAEIQTTNIFYWTDILKKPRYYGIKKLISCLRQVEELDENLVMSERYLVENDRSALKKKIVSFNGRKNNLDQNTNGNAEFDGIVEILTNEELSDAIKCSFKNIDVLLMMNCVMMNIHTAYALKDCVDYFIAPQGLIDSPGYNYSAILKQIQVDNISTETFSDFCVSSCFDFTDPGRLGNKSIIDSWIIVRMYLKSKRFDELVTAIDDLGQFYYESLKETNCPAIFYLPYFNTKFAFPFDYGTELYFLIDIYNWVNIACAIITPDEFGSDFVLKFLGISDTFEGILRDKDFIFGMQGPNIYETTFKGVTRLPANGVSIFLPPRTNLLNETFLNFISKDNIPQTEFFKKNPGWLNFLKEISDLKRIKNL